MALVVKPPAPIPIDGSRASIFLAGSIEMGAAEDWQEWVAKALHDVDAVILNPRRDEWDASWEQSITNPSFREQVEWELSGLERATVVAMYFAPETKAPVTLLELGLCARDGRVVVCCPQGYWRRGNVEVVCRRYGISLFAELGRWWPRFEGGSRPDPGIAADWDPDKQQVSRRVSRVSRENSFGVLC